MPGAREVAHRLLLERERGRVRLEGDALDAADPAERRIVHELVLGVRRHLFLLDAALRPFLRTGLKDASPPLREALRLGAYDLLFRGGLPAPLAVAETVALAGRDAKKRGFLNAVLRRLAESFDVVADDSADPLSRTRVAVEPGRTLEFKRPILQDPVVQPAKHLSTLFSVTEWFAEQMIGLLPLEALEFFRACSTRLPISLRPAAKAGGRAALETRLRAEGCELLGWKGGVVEVRFPAAPGALPALREGICVVQDATAAEVAPFVAPGCGERILDLCAGPGGKTLHLAELAGAGSQVVAATLPSDRQGRLRENLDRAGATNVVVHDLGPQGRGLPRGEFDRVLVDAPCSNSGVLMKRVDARFRLHPKEIETLAGVQLGLLGRAARVLRRGGTLVYSTCSVLPAENQFVVRQFLREHRDFELEEERLRYPHRTRRDGGFLARLRRSEGRGRTASREAAPDPGEPPPPAP